MITKFESHGENSNLNYRDSNCRNLGFLKIFRLNCGIGTKETSSSSFTIPMALQVKRTLLCWPPLHCSFLSVVRDALIKQTKETKHSKFDGAQCPILTVHVQTTFELKR